MTALAPLLLAAIFAFVALRLKVPPVAIVAIILLGGGGYLIAGRPDLAAKPTPPVEAPAGNEAALATAQQVLLQNPNDTAAWARFSDALIADGRSAEAVEGLRLATRALPENAELWVQLGSALMAHAEGVITPAARLAFGRASAVQPNHPAPPYFLGLSELQSGNPGEALAIWQDLQTRTPDDAPWAAELTSKIAAAERMQTAM
ncbi:MAG: tetratricopeptide repeat protein [Pacificimonas sp.]